MTPVGRAVTGFLVGALLTLVAHPVSRPFLLSAAQHVPEPKLERCFDAFVTHPAPPHDLEGASLWLQLAADRVSSHRPLKPGEITTLLGIAKHAGDIDGRNAFWFQEQAVLHSLAGRGREAYAAWQRATRCERWDDLQVRRLFRARARLADLVGSREAWQIAYIYTERTDTPALAIERYGRSLLSQTGLATPADLRVRYTTLLNGELIRLHARSISVGLIGANLVELSAYPSDLVHMGKPKRLWVAQSKFLADLPTTKIPDAEARAQLAFSRTESWLAISRAQDVHVLPEDLSAAAILSSSLIGACAFAATIGFLVWCVGWQVSRRASSGKRLSPVFVVIFASALAALSAWLTHDLSAGVVGLLSGAFLYAGPLHARKARPEDLGPLFALVLVIIALLCGAAIGCFAIAKTAAAEALLPYIGIPADLYMTPLLLGMACIFFSLALTAVPIWAMVQRLATPHVFGLALRKFGAYLGFGALALGIVLGPIAVYADRRIGLLMQRLVENEPIYYIGQFA